MSLDACARMVLIKVSFTSRTKMRPKEGPKIASQRDWPDLIAGCSLPLVCRLLTLYSLFAGLSAFSKKKNRVTYGLINGRTDTHIYTEMRGRS